MFVIFDKLNWLALPLVGSRQFRLRAVEDQLPKQKKATT
jgi:hypothetical protein